jgi:hypothetical protein
VATVRRFRTELWNGARCGGTVRLAQRSPLRDGRQWRESEEDAGLWSSHSRRMDSITRSTYAFCHGLRGLDTTSVIPRLGSTAAF